MADLIQTISNIILIFLAFLGAFLAALWLGLVIWTFRDIRSRSRDFFAWILASLLVAILNLPGLLIYLMLRPQETLAEAYERSLEEEALLQEIEEQELCPGCGQRVESEWIICPYCRTSLKKTCLHCGRPLQLNWTICPYCGTVDRPAMGVAATVSAKAATVGEGDERKVAAPVAGAPTEEEPEPDERGPASEPPPPRTIPTVYDASVE